VRKEFFSILRQPRLVIGLILGPFIVLALFGLGYNGISNFRSIMVVPEGEDYSTNLADYQEVTRENIKLVKVTRNKDEAMRALDRREAELVFEVPANALESLYKGENVIFPVFFRELNPLQVDYIQYSTYAYTSEINRKSLEETISLTKPVSSQGNEASEQLNRSTATLEQSMRGNDQVGATIQLQVMRQTVAISRKGLSSIVARTNNTENTLTSQQLVGETLQKGVQEINGDLDNIDRNLDELESGFRQGDLNSAQQRQRLENIQRSNAAIAEKAKRVAAIPPSVMVEPVVIHAYNQANTQVSYTNFYGPAVLILLIQYLGVTLVALSNVRDRSIGILEIFRIAPTTPSQILVGKSVSFAIWLLILAILLIALITLGLGVPFIDIPNRWVLALITVGVTIYGSIGMGFLVSGLVKTESQAVQWSMLILLGSLFFTGFIVPLSMLNENIAYFSYLLPMTGGVKELQNTMLDTRPLDYISILIIFTVGTVYLLGGYWLYRRQFKVE
jgi:ABC-2 type transport system permease protein